MEEAGFAAQVTDGEAQIRAVVVGSRCEGGDVASTGRRTSHREKRHPQTPAALAWLGEWGTSSPSDSQLGLPETCSVPEGTGEDQLRSDLWGQAQECLFHLSHSSALRLMRSLSHVGKLRPREERALPKVPNKGLEVWERVV